MARTHQVDCEVDVNIADVGGSFSITRGSENTCSHSDDLTVPQQAVIELSLI
jgi:hypothetical protein